MNTMKLLTRAGATAAVLAASVLLTPSPTHAMCPDNTGRIDSSRTQLNDEFVAECLRPLGGIQRSPDVYEGWIDGCRARAGD